MRFCPGDLKPDFTLANLPQTRHKPHCMILGLHNWSIVSPLVLAWLAGAAMLSWLLREVADMDTESDDPAFGLKPKDHESGWIQSHETHRSAG